jgi:hypothetical protein
MTPREVAERVGVKVSVVYYHLRQGKSPQEIIDFFVARDYVGRTFGHLLVLREGDRSSSGKRMYWVRCQRDGCVAEKQVIGADLQSGRTTSCGCLKNEKTSARARARVEDISGRSFADGAIVVVRVSEDQLRPHKHGGKVYMTRTWECSCTLCGNTFYATASSLKLGQVTSCGCLHRGRLLARNAERASKFELFGESLRLDELAAIGEVPARTIYSRIRLRRMTVEAATFTPPERNVSPGRPRKRAAAP